MLALLPERHPQITQLPLQGSLLGTRTVSPHPVTLQVDLQAVPRFCLAALCVSCPPPPQSMGAPFPSCSPIFSKWKHRPCIRFGLLLLLARVRHCQGWGLPGVLGGGHRPWDSSYRLVVRRTCGPVSSGISKWKRSSCLLPIYKEQVSVGFALSPVRVCDESPGQ